jgi:hypothetical protein
VRHETGGLRTATAPRFRGNRLDKFSLANWSQMHWAILAVARTTLHEYCLDYIVTRICICPQIFQHVPGVRPIPEVVMGIHNRAWFKSG